MSTFCTEAFKRVIIESLIYFTHVISSPSCEANTFFKNNEYIKVIPIILNL